VTIRESSSSIIAPVPPDEADGSKRFVRCGGDTVMRSLSIEQKKKTFRVPFTCLCFFSFQTSVRTTDSKCLH
jgi:hypothetical protein